MTLSTEGNHQAQPYAPPFHTASGISKNERLARPLCFYFLISEAFPVNSFLLPCPSALQEKCETGHRMALVRKGACCEPCENQTGLVRLLSSKIL